MVVIEGGVGGVVTVRLNDAELEPPELEAVTVKLKAPATVGVPLIRPVDDARVSPAGRAPLVTLHVMGPGPVADRDCIYADPFSAPGTMVGGALADWAGVGNARANRQRHTPIPARPSVPRSRGAPGPGRHECLRHVLSGCFRGGIGVIHGFGPCIPYRLLSDFFHKEEWREQRVVLSFIRDLWQQIPVPLQPNQAAIS